MVENDFFKKHRLRVKDSKVITRDRRDTIVDKTKDLIYHQIAEITPTEMLYDNLNNLEMRKIIDMLNCISKFWEHNIYIDNWECNKDKFIQRFKELMPLNLHKADLKFSRWKIEHKADEKYKATQLASIYAKSFWDKELDFIKALHGDVGSGSPSDVKVKRFILENYKRLPYFIRTSFVTIKRLKDPKYRKELKQKIYK